MIETVKIAKVFVSDKSKAGKEFMTKAGKKFWKVAIKTDKYPENWYTAFAFKEDDEVMGLKEGVEEKVLLWKEGDWFNFKLPTRLDELDERVATLEQIVKVQGMSKTPSKSDYSDIDNEDVPF